MSTTASLIEDAEKAARNLAERLGKLKSAVQACDVVELEVISQAMKRHMNELAVIDHDVRYILQQITQKGDKA